MSEYNLYKPTEIGKKRFSTPLETYLDYHIISDSFTKKFCLKHPDNPTKLCGFPSVNEAKSFIEEYLKEKGRNKLNKNNK